MSENNTVMNNRSTKKNFAFSALLQIVIYLIPLLTAPYLSRVLGPEGIGEYSYASSIVGYFVMVVNFGFLGYGTLRISEKRDNIEERSGVFWSIVLVRFILFIFAFSAYLVTIFLLYGHKGYNLTIYLILALNIFVNLFDITYLFQGLENFKIISIINVSIRLSSVGLIFIFVRNSEDLVIYILISTVQLLLMSILPWLFVRGAIIRPKKDYINLKDTTKTSLFYFLPTLAVTLYTLVDKTMLGSLAGNAETGYYEQSTKIVSMVIGVIHALAPVMLARIAYLIKNGNEEEVHKKIGQMFNVYFLIGFPSIIGLFCICGLFMPSFFGDDFTPAVGVMYFLIPLILIKNISNALGNVFYGPRNQIHMTSIFYFVGAFVNIFGNALLIPSLKAQGAAIASLFSETLITILFVIFSRKGIRYGVIIKTAFKPMLASLIMGFALLILNSFVWSNIISNRLIIIIVDVLIGACIYGAFVIIFRDPMVLNEIKVLRQKINNFSLFRK